MLNVFDLFSFNVFGNSRNAVLTEKEEVDSSKTQFINTSAELSKAENTIGELQMQKAELERRYARENMLRDQLNQSQLKSDCTLSNESTGKGRLRLHLNTLTQQHNTAFDQVSQLSKEPSEVRDNYKGSITAQRVLDTDSNKINTQLFTRNATCMELSEQNKEMKSQTLYYQDMIRSLEENVSRLEHENKNLKRCQLSEDATFSEVGNNEARFGAIENILSQSSGSIIEQYSALLNQQQANSNTMQGLQTTDEKLLHSADTLQNAFNYKTRLLAQYQKRVAQLENEVASHQSAVSQLQRDAVEVGQSHQEELDRKQNVLVNTMINFGKQITQMKEDARQDAKQYHSQYKQLKNQYNDAVRASKRKDDNIIKIKDKYDELLKMKRELKDVMGKMKEKISEDQAKISSLIKDIHCQTHLLHKRHNTIRYLYTKLSLTRKSLTDKEKGCTDLAKKSNNRGRFAIWFKNKSTELENKIKEQNKLLAEQEKKLTEEQAKVANLKKKIEEEAKKKKDNEIKKSESTTTEHKQQETTTNTPPPTIIPLPTTLLATPEDLVAGKKRAQEVGEWDDDERFIKKNKHNK